MVKIFRVGDEDILTMAETIKAFLEGYERELPQGIAMTIWQDESKELRCAGHARRQCCATVSSWS